MAVNQMLAKIQPQSPVTADWDQYILLNHQGHGVSLRQVYDEIEARRGKLALAARNLNVPLHDLVNAANLVSVLHDQVNLFREMLVDLAEEVVEEALTKARDPITAMQVLRTAGARRGWDVTLANAEKPKTLKVVMLDNWREGEEEPEMLDMNKKSDAPAQFTDAEIIAEANSSSSDTSAPVDADKIT